MDTGHREILRHSVIGGLVAVTLTWSEKGVHSWSADLFEGRPSWLEALTLSGVFVAAFFLIMGMELFLGKAPLRLPSIGRVDGLWVNVLLEEDSDRPQQVSLMTISSSYQGFSFSGETYDAGAVQACLEPTGLRPIGDFSGKGHALGDGRLYYHYEGHTGRVFDRGVGFFHFWTNPLNHSELRYDGTFIGLNNRAPSRSVCGRKVSRNERKGMQADNGAKLLLLRKAASSTKESPPGHA